MERPGVVIFKSDYFTDEGIAALHWASNAFKKTSKVPVNILLVEEIKDQQEPKIVQEKKKDRAKEEKNRGIGKLTAAMVTKQGEVKFRDQKSKDKAIDRFDDCKNRFNDKCVTVTICGGANIPKTLEKAIKDCDLDTLVVGMAALGKTCKKDVQLQPRSKCSVVLVNIIEGSETLKTTAFKIIPPPEGQTSQNAGN